MEALFAYKCWRSCWKWIWKHTDVLCFLITRVYLFPCVTAFFFFLWSLLEITFAGAVFSSLFKRGSTYRKTAYDYVQKKQLTPKLWICILPCRYNQSNQKNAVILVHTKHLFSVQYIFSRKTDSCPVSSTAATRSSSLNDIKMEVVHEGVHSFFR